MKKVLLPRGQLAGGKSNLPRGLQYESNKLLMRKIGTCRVSRQIIHKQTAPLVLSGYNGCICSV